MTTSSRRIGACALVIGAFGWTSTTTPRAQQATPVISAASTVPKDLKPFLTPRRSELRLVTQWYAGDRTALEGNFLPGSGGGRGGGRGRGAGAPAAQPATPPITVVSLSPNRIARLKRFDLDWQSTLNGLDATGLSDAARADLQALKQTVAANLAALDTEAATIARLSPLAPFAPHVIQVYEARVRIENMDARKAAGTIDAATKLLAQVRAKLVAGLATGAMPSTGIRADAALATQAAAAVDALRASTAEWFNFYNGYDPLFTWWLGLPYKQFDAGLTEYAAFLRNTVAAANQASANVTPIAATIAPAAAPQFPSVPDLRGLIALPQDELIDIVPLFRGNTGGGGGRGGGRGAAPAGGPPAPVRDVAFHQAWLEALKTLDFDRLSRNAQVNYLAIKKVSEMQIARVAFVPQTNIPRKTDNSGIEGAARGRDGLLLDLADEMIPYTPEELIELGNREFAWTVAEMEKASREMGLAGDWFKALERTKDTAVPAGKQPELIRDLMLHAVDYLRKNDLITVPAVAAESLHMGMMSPERQLVNPFFTGGAIISVSYPTDTMTYDQRIQSMRGNNPGFSNATAHHEMIPGHHLTYYLGSRLNGHRANLGINTPFYGEGWPLYWETILYDMGFHDTPEKKVGALFWRMHRAARIVFSVKFHMGQWSPEECVNFLVNEVGHERENAIAEVRRSFQGNYGPLYQAAYLLGGLQLRGLRKELVDTGVMTNKQFHDAVMLQGSMPIPLIRLALTPEPLTRGMSLDWKFYPGL